MIRQLRPLLAVLVLLSAAAVSLAATPEFYVGVDGGKTVATWSIFGGKDNPNHNRLSFLYGHRYDDDPKENHFHTVGVYSLTGGLDSPTVVDRSVYTFYSGDPPQLYKLPGHTIPEQFSDFGVDGGPLVLRPGAGLFADKLTTGYFPGETYSNLEIRSANELLAFAEGTSEHYLLHNTEPYGEHWTTSLAGAVVALELISKSPGLNIGSLDALSVLASPGDRQVLGAGESLAFTPVLWTAPDAAPGTYSAEFKLVDVRTSGTPFGESGVFQINTQVVPEPSALLLAFVGSAGLCWVVRRARR